MDSLMQSFGNILPTIFHSMSMSFSDSILFFVFFSINPVGHVKAFRSFSASFSLVLYKIDLLSPLALLLKLLSYTPSRVGSPYRIVPYRTFPIRFGSARARYYRARAEHTPCTVRYDLFCERDMAIRFGSV